MRISFLTLVSALLLSVALPAAGQGQERGMPQFLTVDVAGSETRLTSYSEGVAAALSGDELGSSDLSAGGLFTECQASDLDAGEEVVAAGELYARGELLYLHPYSSFLQGLGRFNLELAPRLTAGWRAPCDLGIQGRYFEYDHAAGFFNGAQSLELHALDAEVTREFCFYGFTAVATGGARYVEFTNDIIQPGLRTLESFEGWGPTISLEVTHHVTERVSLYGGGRVSILMGKAASEFSFAGPLNVTPDSRAARSIYELGLGLQFEHQFCSCVTMVGRFGYEAQNWAEFYQQNFFGGGDTDLVLGGFVSGLELRY